MATLAVACVLVFGVDRAIAQDAGAPPWGEFLRRFNRDPLLRKPFHMDPAEGVKGLASKIRARELDIPNRRRAIRYLADLDCRQFPEAKQTLLAQLNPEVERWEEVRFEAARGLRDMLARHACTDTTATAQCEQCDSRPGVWEQCCTAADKARSAVSRDRKDKKKNNREEEDTTSCHCKSCCDADTLNTLARTAYELKENGCCYEPSLRVREMAVLAIQACGVPCNYAPYYGSEHGPPPVDEQGGPLNQGGGEVRPPDPGEQQPDAPGTSTGILLPVRPDLTSVTPISRLTNICVVSLKRGERKATDPQFSAAWRGRLYYFASAAEQAEFGKNPEAYAVAFGGCDPVHYVQTHEVVEGRYLTIFEDRFYMFASQENVATFHANPEQFCNRPKTETQLTVSR